MYLRLLLLVPHIFTQIKIQPHETLFQRKQLIISKFIVLKII